MLTIELIGVDFNNKGAMLMLDAVLQRLDQAPVKNRFVIAPNSHASYQQRSATGAWQKIELKRFGTDLGKFVGMLPSVIRRRLALWGLLTERDVDLVLDLSGYAYGDPWPDYRLRYQAAYAERLNQRGKAYVLLPQALGPFDNQARIPMVEKLLANSQLIFARDAQSLAACKSLNHSAQLTQCPDFTIDVKATELAGISIPDNAFTLIPNHKMQTHVSEDSPWQGKYLDILTTWISLARAAGLQPILLNHEGPADKALCQQLAERFVEEIPYFEFDNARAIKAVIAQSRLVLSSRYHGCVSALTQGVPVLATSWSHKYQELFADFNCPDHIISPQDGTDGWSALLNKVMAEQSDYSSAITNYQSQTDQLWSRIYQLMQDLHQEVQG